MRIRRDRGQGHIIHGGIGVFLHRPGWRWRYIYIYLPWLRLRIDLTPRRSK